MAEASIKLERNFIDPQHGEKSVQEVNPEDYTIKVFDGNKLVAETSVTNMVQKFLLISAEYARILYAIGAIKPNAESKIIINGETTKESDA